MKGKFVIVSVLLALVLALSLVGCVPQGERGAAGSQGKQGEQGIQGVPGPPGPKGDTGAQGEQGLKGEQGEQGERGKRGYEGDKGERGPRGLKGATGAKGDKGDTGDTGPAFSNLGILLYVEDGTKKISHVTYVLDEPIALEDLTELMFFQELVYGTGSFGANVILGIDVDGDGYEANDLAWHIGDTVHNPAVLGDDTFIEMDGVPLSVAKVDALSVSQWWTPNAAGDGFGGDPSYYGSLQGITGTGNTRITSESMVRLIRLVLGGSGSWMDIAVRVTSEMIPSEVGVYPHWGKQ